MPKVPAETFDPSSAKSNFKKRSGLYVFEMFSDRPGSRGRPQPSGRPASAATTAPAATNNAPGEIFSTVPSQNAQTQDRRQQPAKRQMTENDVSNPQLMRIMNYARTQNEQLSDLWDNFGEDFDFQITDEGLEILQNLVDYARREGLTIEMANGQLTRAAPAQQAETAEGQLILRVANFVKLMF